MLVTMPKFFPATRLVLFPSSNLYSLLSTNAFSFGSLNAKCWRDVASVLGTFYSNARTYGRGLSPRP